MAFSTVAGLIPPTLENQFGLDIADEYRFFGRNKVECVWQNPHLNSPITPYVPSDDDKALLASCEAALKNQNSFIELTPEALFTTNDVSVIIFSHLDPKSLICCSKVCKCFYLTTKNQILWDNLFASSFKNVKPLASEVCIFTPQQQFQIIYKKINDHKKPYFAKFDHLQEISLAHFHNQLQLILQYTQAGGSEAADNANKEKEEIDDSFVGENIVTIDVDETQKRLAQVVGSPGYKASLLIKKILLIDYYLHTNVGKNYNGTVESIDGNSWLGRILTAIELSIPNTFDNQEEFEEAIRQSEASKITNSLNDGPVVEDVTDVAQPRN